MSPDQTNLRIPGQREAALELASRCRELGLETLIVDLSVPALAVEPESPVTAALLDVGERCVSGSPDSVVGSTPAPTQLADGRWVAPLIHRRGDRLCWIVAPVLPAGPEGHPTIPEHVLRMLGWMRDDLVTQIKDACAINEFSVQLTEMYEEIGLLYRVGRSMNRVLQPADFVQGVCDDLQRTLPFGWVAMKFLPTVRVAVGLSGRLFTSGNVPIAMDDLDSSTLEVVAHLSSSWSLLRPRDSELARLASCQVLAHPIVRDGMVVGGMFAGDKQGDDRDVSSLETQLLDAAAGYLGVFLENAALYGDQRDLFIGLVQALTASIDAKDRYTFGHSERVALMGACLAEALGLDPQEIERVRIAGLLHDVGKIGVPEAVLTKPGRLSADEYEQIKRHPEIGHRILQEVPFIDDVLPGVLHHHERWDGGGYPHGLNGSEIPQIARILNVADAFDAMSSDRSYRAAMPRERVLAEILRCAGTQFDPAMAGVFVGLDFGEFDRLVSMHCARERSAA